MVGAVDDAKQEWLATRKPGQRNDFFGASDSQPYLVKAINARLPGAQGAGKDLDAIASSVMRVAEATSDRGGRTKPFILKNVKRPLFLVDVGGFSPDTVLQQLRQMPEFGDKARVLLDGIDRLPMDQQAKAVQKLIESRGYDSAVYLNTTSEGSSASRYANPGLENVGSPQGYSPSFMIWREDQIVNLDDPKLFPKGGASQLKKALAGLIALPAAEATKDKDNGSTD